MNTILLAVIASFAILPATAKDNDVPRGYTPLADYKSVQAKAIADKKLVVLVVKGADDECPNCAAAMENGESATGSGVEKLFVRAEAINKDDPSGLPPVLQTRLKKKGFTYGSWVTFVVFNPEMTEIVAEADRKDLQSNKEAIAVFKKTVQAAKKALK